MPITITHVVEALSALGGRATVEEIHRKVVEIAPAPIPKSSRQVVRGRLQDHSSDSSHYRGKGDFFRSVHGLADRRGIWELTPEAGGIRIVQSEGKAQVDALRRIQPPRNPKWSRDELILALDMYMNNPASPPSKTSAEVVALSALLNKMHRLSGADASPTLRNENGVYLKMMNLRALDPAFIVQGKVGMQAGGNLEKVVWKDYAGQRDRLADDARAIRVIVETAVEGEVAKLPVGEPYEGEEGGVVLRLHKRYERDRKLVAEKRKAALIAGELACEACSFDFKAAYGSLGEGYIEVHHTKPVHSLVAGTKTKLADLALLCANCHRIAHRRRTPLSVDEIKGILAKASKAATSTR